MDNLSSIFDWKKEQALCAINYIASIKDLIDTAINKNRVITLHYIPDLAEEIIVLGNTLLRQEGVVSNIETCSMIISSGMVLDNLRQKQLLSGIESSYQLQKYDVDLFRFEKKPFLYSKNYHTVVSHHLGIYTNRKVWESSREMNWYSQNSFPIDAEYMSDLPLGNKVLLVFTTKDGEDHNVDYCYLCSIKEPEYEPAFSKTYDIGFQEAYTPLEDKNIPMPPKEEQVLGCAQYVNDLIINMGFRPIDDHTCEQAFENIIC